MKLKGKTFVVTGAGSGMGRELTIQLVKKGASVAMADLNARSLKETASLAGQSYVSFHILDISNREAIEKLPKDVLKHHGQVDGIVNNAGIIQPFVDVKDLDYDKIEKVININFYGTLYMIKTFLPYLLDRPEATITNISSMGGYIPFPGQTVYSASKAAVKLLTEGLYGELKKTNVHVTVVHPGAIDTHIMSNSGLSTTEEETEIKKTQKNKALSADKAASIIIEGIEKEKFRVLVGSDASFLDKFYRLSPKRAVDFIVKKMGGMGH
ncbi:MAG: SDR family NAD(P)-dependent oxidoreductase [Cyclobacteriaceae bacterium]|nr:SDR family NAD(P)-dependent oxidoreductase [Cyclobacteriaceae bacterium SS2]